MSLTHDREPVEVWMLLNGHWQWAVVRRYIIHRGKSRGWITYVNPDCEVRYTYPANWRKVSDGKA